MSFKLQNASKNNEDEDEEMHSVQDQSSDDTYDSEEEDDINDSNNDSNVEDDKSENNVNVDEASDNSDDTNKGMSYNSDQNAEQYSTNEDDDSATDDQDSYNISDTVERKGIQTITQTNMRADIEKGNCVRTQLRFWESLLEMRIKLQKCLTVSNQMPQHNVSKDFKTDVEYSKTVDETKSKLNVLLSNMLQLQTFLLKQYPETKNLSTNGRKRKADESIDKDIINAEDPMDEEIPSDTEDENENENESENRNESKNESSDEHMQDVDKNASRKTMKLNNYERILNDNHNSYVEYRNTVIHKWNEKTRLANGKLNKGANETTLKQIEFALNDKDKLRKRSRLKRSEYKIMGKTESVDDNEGRRVQEYDSEIYDDDDFYHQLLRDLIEYKSSDITDPIQLSKQWIKLQNMRTKMKRTIDTRATKGRRIRYNVHNKLVNFMAPITVNDTWMDSAKDELYNSLFGKIKATNADVGR